MKKKIKKFFQDMMPKQRSIQFVSLPDFDDIDKVFFDNQAAETYDSLTKILHNKISLTFTFKEYSKKGMRRQYEVKCRLNSPGMNFYATEKGWKRMKVINSCLKALEREVRKKLKNR